MRVIEALNMPVRAIAASPCGTYLAASGDSKCAVLDLLTGAKLAEWDLEGLGILDPPRVQPVFVANNALLIARSRGLFCTDLDQSALQRLATRRVAAGPFSGGLATSPDGKTLVATRTGQHQDVKLEQ